MAPGWPRHSLRTTINVIKIVRNRQKTNIRFDSLVLEHKPAKIWEVRKFLHHAGRFVGGLYISRWTIKFCSLQKCLIPKNFPCSGKLPKMNKKCYFLPFLHWNMSFSQRFAFVSVIRALIFLISSGIKVFLLFVPYNFESWKLVLHVESQNSNWRCPYPSPFQTVTSPIFFVLGVSSVHRSLLTVESSTVNFIDSQLIIYAWESSISAFASIRLAYSGVFTRKGSALYSAMFSSISLMDMRWWRPWGVRCCF